MALKNYYEVLGVSPNAAVEEIRDAYREMAGKYKNANNVLDEFSQMMLSNINEAVEVLTNSEKRADYDKTLAIMDEGTRAASVHSGISQGDVARINDLSEKHFELEKSVNQKYESYLANKNTKAPAYFTMVKVLFSLVLIAGAFYYYHPQHFEFLKGTPVEDQRSYEWYTKDTTLIYAKPKNKAKVLKGVGTKTGFNTIGETTYHYKVTFTDEDGKSREGYIKKEDLEKSEEMMMHP